jgi:hypothetical protein
MALVMIYPEVRPGKKTLGSATTLSEANKVSSARLSQARSVLRWSRAKAEGVLAGSAHLDAALAEMREEQSKLKSTEGMTAELRLKAPDLAELR